MPKCLPPAVKRGIHLSAGECGGTARDHEVSEQGGGRRWVGRLPVYGCEHPPSVAGEESGADAGVAVRGQRQRREGGDPEARVASYPVRVVGTTVMVGVGR